jgi:hypothetical protein
VKWTDGAKGSRPTDGDSPKKSSSSGSSPKAKVSTGKADAATVARYDAMLVQRITTTLKAGDRPRFYLASVRSKARVLEIKDTGVLIVETIRPPMKFNIAWKKLAFNDKRSLALGVLHEGDDEEHALVAFFALASGDKKAGKTHLSKAGQAGDAVRAAFE